MPDNLPPDSVGLVSAQSVEITEPLTLACGKTLEQHTLVYECYGELNADKSNAILICHALSGHHHAAGYYSMDDKKPGWWDSYIGPGKPIDTNLFYVVSINNIGGCHGSTGPQSINPETGESYGPDFPPLRARDWVNSQLMLMTRLGIDCWAAVVGGSLGGMQAMRWSLEYPDKLQHCVVIASAMKLTAQNIAFNEIARKAITSDPNFHQGRYQDFDTVPAQGLSIARMVGHLTYLSNDAMDVKFGRELRSGSFTIGNDDSVEFQVESYLRYQGNVFSQVFDANTYLLMTKALDYFDLAREYGHDPVKAFSHSQCSYMVISFNSDWRFSSQRSKEIVEAMVAAQCPVSYVDIESSAGHDAFLLPNQRYQHVFTAYMQRVFRDISGKGKQ
jgi:homoserine O-acetyltransferase